MKRKYAAHASPAKIPKGPGMFALLAVVGNLTALGLLLPAADASDSTVLIQNTRVEVAYHLDRGTFDLIEMPSGRSLISSAHSEVWPWNSTDPGFVRTAKIADATDELGAARRLVVKCARPGAPTLIAEFEVHGAADTFVTLRLGLENTTMIPIRIKEFYPLKDGMIFPGGQWTDIRSLNGDSGGAEMEVDANPFRSSANNLLLTCQQDGRRRSLVLGGLKVADFTKWALTEAPKKESGLPVSVGVAPSAGGQNLHVLGALKGSDPVGRLVDPGSTYLPDDSFYVDGGTPNPFRALELYGQRLALATEAQPHAYDFPTLCAWYIGVRGTPGAQNHPQKSLYRINTTAGLVKEIGWAREKGFLRYSRLAGRLVPDTYASLNPQGWWDDEHWQQGGYYVAPYDTSQKFGRAMHAAGGLAFTYFQPWAKLSEDFKRQHPDWLCGRDIHRALDFTNPEVQEYFREVFSAMRGGIDGMMVDYCDDLWSRDAGRGGFYDPHATSTDYYRAFFKLAKEGLGLNSWLHERNVHAPNNDLTLGFADSQRTSGDTEQISPAMVSRSGLRWYKDRVVLDYDMDSKKLDTGWKISGFTGSDTDGRRMMLTMSEIAGSRLLLANSFRDLSPEAQHDLSRIFPYYSERQSARPVDAFAFPGKPRIYDFAVDSDWHQIVLYNNALPTKTAEFSVPLSGDEANGALGLDPGKDYYVYDFWNDCFVGRSKGSATLNQTLRPGEARMLSIHAVEPCPQFISTNRHIMQGYVDMPGRPVWNAVTRVLSGSSNVVGGETYKIVVALNGFRVANVSIDKGRIRVEPFPGDENLALLEMDALDNATVAWQVECKAP